MGGFELVVVRKEKDGKLRRTEEGGETCSLIARRTLVGFAITLIN